MTEKLRLPLTALMLFFITSNAVAITSLSAPKQHVFTLHPCPALTANCFTTKTRHFVGYISVLQFPRMYRNQVVCLPNGQFITRTLIKKIIARCDNTYPYSCKKHGCSVRMEA